MQHETQTTKILLWKMNLSFNVFCVIFILGKHYGMVCGQKTGRCPQVTYAPEGASCSHQHDCLNDNNCDGYLKCCEDSCGISRCLKPIKDAIITRKKETCQPRHPRILGCKEIETKFCYTENCQRCCLYKNSCNPDDRILTTVARCHRELCRNYKCAQQGSRCEVDKSTDVPMCVCRQSCPVQADPVCGEDGRTYDNKCFLDKQACEKNKEMRVLYSGICTPSTSKPEIKVVRPDINGKSGVIETGEELSLRCKSSEKEAKLKWLKRIGNKRITMPNSMINSSEGNSVTLMIQKTVFAHSGTYICQMTRRGKHQFAEVTLQIKVKEHPNATCRRSKDAGQCDGNFRNYYYDAKEDTCKLFQYGGCRGNNNNFEKLEDCEKLCKGIRMACPTPQPQSRIKCPDDIKDSCSDNKDCTERLSCCYDGCRKVCLNASSPLTSWLKSTTTKSPLTDESKSKARHETNCGRHICRFYAECKMNQNGNKECVCRNACEFFNLRPVCGKDLETGLEKNYPSECFLKITACRLQKDISMTYGPCDSQNGEKRQKPVIDLCDLRRCPRYGICSINPFNGLPQCLCPRFCNLMPKVICASDGTTYLNECVMRVKSCKKDFYLTKQHDGPCVR